MSNMGKKISFQLAVFIGVLLILSSLLLICLSFRSYKAQLIESQDEQLYDLAETIQQNLQYTLHNYVETMKYELASREVFEAKQKLILQGDKNTLQQSLSDTITNRNSFTQTVLVLDSGNIILSTNGKTNYKAIWTDHSPTRLGSHIVEGEDKRLYLGLCVYEEHSISYLALIDLLDFYQVVVSALPDRLPARSSGNVMLVDRGENVLIHPTGKGLRADAISTLRLQEKGCDFHALDSMLAFQHQNKSGATFYETLNCDTKKPYKAHIVVVPAGNNPGEIFTIGITLNYDALVDPIYQSAIHFTICLVLLTLGISIILYRLFLSRMERKAFIAEKEELLEKNRMMEEINRQTQELAHHQRLQTIGTLTSSLAHEFNNLLTPIMGYSIMTLEQLPPELNDLYDNILEIYQASVKAKTIISRMSELSRKNVSLTFQKVSITELCEKLSPVTKPILPPGVQIIMEGNCKNVFILGNELQLNQMLLNLTINAFHAMAKDGGTLTISTEEAEGHLILRFRDTGAGIPDEILPHIFEPFFSTKESGEGTGLGLAIVQQIVESHNGTTEVQSRLGEGTLFTITLPIAKA